MDKWDKLLLTASEANNHAALREALSNGANVNAADENQKTGLILAAKRGNTTIVRELLMAGADPNRQDDVKNTALAWASSLGDLDMVQMLLGCGADPNIQDGKGATCLHFASTQGHGEAVRWLLAAGADTEIITSSDSIPLCAASLNGHTDTVNYLLAGGAAVDAIGGSNNTTPLIAATINNHKDVVKTLLASDADIHIKDADNKRALDYATNPKAKYNEFNTQVTNSLHQMRKNKEYSGVRKLLESAENDKRPAAGNTVSYAAEKIETTRLDIAGLVTEWSALRSDALRAIEARGDDVAASAAPAEEALSALPDGGEVKVYGAHTKRILEANEALRHEADAMEALASEVLKDKFFAELAFRKGWGPQQAAAADDPHVVLKRNYEDGPIPEWKAEFWVGADQAEEGLHNTLEKMKDQMLKKLDVSIIDDEDGRKAIQTGFQGKLEDIIAAFNEITSEAIGPVDMGELQAAAKVEARAAMGKQSQTDLAR